jgi:hypothetical protein
MVSSIYCFRTTQTTLDSTFRLSKIAHRFSGNTACEWTSAKVGSALLDLLEPLAAEAAARMKIAISCLLEMSKGTNRVIAVPILVQALAKDNLDSGVIQTVEEAISLALQDSDEAVRFFTVDALGSFGGFDMIPALKEVAESDSSPEIQGHSLRKSATQAIARIQKRASRQ